MPPQKAQPQTTHSGSRIDATAMVKENRLWGNEWVIPNKPGIDMPCCIGKGVSTGIGVGEEGPAIGGDMAIQRSFHEEGMPSHPFEYSELLGATIGATVGEGTGTGMPYLTMGPYDTPYSGTTLVSSATAASTESDLKKEAACSKMHEAAAIGNMNILLTTPKLMPPSYSTTHYIFIL